MKNVRVFFSEKFQFLEVKFSIYLNRHVYVMFCYKLPTDDLRVNVICLNFLLLVSCVLLTVAL